MKRHPFFYGVDWESIRQIDAPFVPHLRSVTDTSYFPTEELEQVSEEPAEAEPSGASQDLAFLGYASFDCQLAHLIPLLPVTHSSDFPFLRMHFENSHSPAGRGLPV